MAVHFLTTDVTTNSSNEKWHLTRNRADDYYAPEGCLVFHTESGDFVPWDNPNNLISHEVPRMVDAVVGAVCMPLLFLISAPANVLNMLVFWKQGLKERVNLCLFYLSLVDFLHMCHAFLCNVDRFHLPAAGTEDFGPVFRFMVEYKLLGLRSLTWLSGFVSMLIACDRCFCVVSPLRSQTLLSTRTAGLVLAFATVFCVAGSLVNGMRWTLPCVFDPRTNATYEKLLTSQFYARNRAHMNLLSLFVATIQPTVYVTVIVATTIVIAVKLRSMTAWREQVSSSSGILSSREVALTRMLIAVSVLYIFCSAPNAVLGLGVMFVRDVSFSGRHYNLATLLIDVIEFASYVNATFNFFIYYSLGSKYRDTLQMLFTCRDGASDKKKQRK